MEYQKKSEPKKIYLPEWADASCKKCYGRGFIGHFYGRRNTEKFEQGEPIPCQCVKRNYHRKRRTKIVSVVNRQLKPGEVSGNMKLTEIVE